MSGLRRRSSRAFHHSDRFLLLYLSRLHHCRFHSDTGSHHCYALHCARTDSNTIFSALFASSSAQVQLHCQVVMSPGGWSWRRQKVAREALSCISTPAHPASCEYVAMLHSRLISRRSRARGGSLVRKKILMRVARYVRVVRAILTMKVLAQLDRWMAGRSKVGEDWVRARWRVGSGGLCPSSSPMRGCVDSQRGCVE